MISPKAIWDDQNLTSTQKLVWLALWYAAEGRLCEITVSEVARLTGLSERAVQKALKDLDESGRIARQMRDGAATKYFLR